MCDVKDKILKRLYGCLKKSTKPMHEIISSISLCGEDYFKLKSDLHCCIYSEVGKDGKFKEKFHGIPIKISSVTKINRKWSSNRHVMSSLKRCYRINDEIHRQMLNRIQLDYNSPIDVSRYGIITGINDKSFYTLK